MAFKLLAIADKRWRRLDGRHLLPLVLAGVKFVDGVGPEADRPLLSQPTIDRRGSPDDAGPIHNI